MSWILIALVPPFLWALGNIATKVIRTRHIKDTLSYTIIGSLISSSLMIGILFRPISFKFELIYFVPILCGALLMLQYFFYIKAVSLEDVSTLIPFFNFDPLMVLILSTIFLDEVLAPRHYIAFALLAAGGILISLKKNKLHFSKGVILIVASAFIWSVYSVIAKFTLDFMDSWSFYMLVRAGILVIILCFIVARGVRERISSSWLSLSNKTRFAVAITELSGALGVLFLVYAVSLAPVSLVTAVGGLQPLFVLLIAAMLSFRFPKILKEEINKKVIAQKSIAIILMSAGLVLL